jgi:hypothetical protein
MREGLTIHWHFPKSVDKESTQVLTFPCFHIKHLTHNLEYPMSVNLKKTIATLLIPIFLSACATAGKDVTATYVSPAQFSSYDCEQLKQEMLRVQGRANQLSGRLDEAASNDKAIVGVGMILFWPALFALGGTKQQEAELSRLKGEYDALSAAAVSKKCS